MKKRMFKSYSISYLLIIILLGVLMACQNKNEATLPRNEQLHQLFDQYWEQRLQNFPLEATAYGDSSYNDQLPVLFSATNRDKLRRFYLQNLEASKKIKEPLNPEDAISKELFEYEMQINLDAFNYPGYHMPINQFWSFTLEFPQLGSGSGNQPFKTEKDYRDFLKRMQLFQGWCDTAIQNMKEGMSQGIVLPQILASKVIPQLQQVLTTDPTKNIFYQPIHQMPASFNDSLKKALSNAYFYEISHSIIPSYARLKVFFEKEYLPACRQSFGLDALPKGKEWYQYLIRYYTTTNLSPDTIYQMGIQEVDRLTAEMEKVKAQVGFKGDLQSFFDYLNHDPQFFPFTSAQAVLDSFWAINRIQEPFLKKMFKAVPKTKFEIRQTEAYRAASASAEYNAGSEDGTRPGIFYTPILDPRKFNIVGMETLFLHEAIPGHHYQISLQQENKELPAFRKFLGYSAYAEGWALYTETLGPELGLFKNPYQYFGHLSDAMHRAIRLVVDVAIHTRQMSRDSAIAYMRSHERISLEEATAEIERYMAIPGQALSYKIGQFKIMELRKKYEQQLGNRFSLADFHEQILNGGNMPLEVLEKKLQGWADNF
jgi:uncharacterized protein (DUF885 family)